MSFLPRVLFRRTRRRIQRNASLLSLMLIIAVGNVRGAPPVTDYEWELEVSGRTLFRDLKPVGRISLVHTSGQGGLLGKKGKETGEAVMVQTDVSFVPGDTTRYFALSIGIFDGNHENASAVVDVSELAGLHAAMKYMLETAGHILDTDRSDTRITHRTKSGITVMFGQNEKHQYFALAIPGADGGTVKRLLYPDQFSSLRDLLELSMFELRRQGAQFEQVIQSTR